MVFDNKNGHKSQRVFLLMCVSVTQQPSINCLIKYPAEVKYYYYLGLNCEKPTIGWQVTCVVKSKQEFHKYTNINR